jgi:metal-dependent amidase/aminoacylase/carboxypeptidase family protein
VEMRGTIRSFDEGMRDAIHERITTLAEGISTASRATCKVCITKNYPVTRNDPVLTEQMVPTLTRVASTGPRPMGIEVVPKATGAEDFSFFQRLIPGLFFFVGVTPPDIEPSQAYSNHSPRFVVDERGLEVGVRALAHLAVDYLGSIKG